MSNKTMTIDQMAAEIRAKFGDDASDELARKLKFGQEGAAQAGLDPYANPLAVPQSAYTELDAAISEKRSHRYQVDISAAALTTGTHGQPTDWGEKLAGAPRLLHMVARVPMVPAGAVAGEFPVYTLPTAAAGVAEGASLGEYDNSTGGTVTLNRFGRFTDLTKEGLVGTSAAGVTRLHRIAIAKDLNQVLVDAAETDAGAAVAFESDVPAAIRKRIASVSDATETDATALTILAHPDDAHLLQDVTPASASDVAEGFTRFSGALVFPTSYVTSGIMVVANLAFGCSYLRAQDVRLATDVNIKTGVQTYATDLIGGYATGQISGYAEAQDVVTP